jgi:hypothetical protein
MTRRILHKLVIADVSTVDRPANKHARAIIIKRDTGDDIMTDTEQEYLAECSPKEKANYLAASPADRKKIIAADANDAEDASTKHIAEKNWNEARDAYLQRNNLSFAKGVTEFAVTEEGRRLYRKYINAPPGLPIAKKAQPLTKAQQTIATMEVTLEEVSKSAFPGDKTPTAIANYLQTPEGKEFYDDYLAEKRDVGAA